MKNFVYFFAAFLLMLSSCEYDNYDPPKSQLTGRFVYKGNPVRVRQGLNVLQLYEPGWENFDPISVNIKQDGTFSALLFNGDYQLVLIDGNGPWVNQPDTINVHVEGSEMIDISVEPFFWISNVSFQLEGSTLTATFNVEHNIEDRDLQFISLFIGETMLVDNRFNVGEERVGAGAVSDLGGSISLSMDLAGVEEDYVFARLGVKAKGNSELIFSEVQKINLN